VPKISIKD
jgi:hypothetical protein